MLTMRIVDEQENDQQITYVPRWTEERFKARKWTKFDNLINNFMDEKCSIALLRPIEDNL